MTTVRQMFALQELDIILDRVQDDQNKTQAELDDGDGIGNGDEKSLLVIPAISQYRLKPQRIYKVEPTDGKPSLHKCPTLTQQTHTHTHQSCNASQSNGQHVLELGFG